MVLQSASARVRLPNDTEEMFKEIMKKLLENLYYVGAANPDLRIFDIIIPADRGTTYNAYLLRGEKTALIETVQDSFAPTLLENIRQVCDPAEVDYIICNHTEPDHSGALAEILKSCPNAVVYGSFAAVKNLKNILNTEFKSVAARNKTSLDLGGYTLEFISAPNLHWPDSMFTYCPELKTVFTCDFLGAHFSGAVTDEEITDVSGYDEELAKYNKYIFGPFGEAVKSGAQILRGLDIQMACPSHGPVLKSMLQSVIDRYDKWADSAAVPGKIAVFYVSAYGYTKAMAEALARGAEKGGAEVCLYNVTETAPEVLAEAVETSSGYMFGSPTLNRDALPPIRNVMNMISAVSCRGRKAFIFGSYGWSGEACGSLAQRAGELGLKIFGEPAKICFKPTAEDIANLEKTGEEFAAAE